MHILCVTGINYDDGVAFNTIGVIPLAGVCHVKFCPSAYRRCTAQKCFFYPVNREERVANIPLHVFIRIGVAVFAGHIDIELPNLLEGHRADDIVIPHL